MHKRDKLYFTKLLLICRINLLLRIDIHNPQFEPYLYTHYNLHLNHANHSKLYHFVIRLHVFHTGLSSSWQPGQYSFSL
jgi:hypothetical protein